MKNKFVVGNEKVFRIEAFAPNSLTSCVVIGDENNNLEITMDSDTKRIASIESLYVDNILNEKLYLPDFNEDNTLAKILYPNFSYDKSNLPSYVLNFNRNEVNIVISDKLEASYYCLDDRIEYYYDENFNLIFVRVNSLTEEEYEFFKKIYSNRKSLG